MFKKKILSWLNFRKNKKKDQVSNILQKKRTVVFTSNENNNNDDKKCLSDNSMEVNVSSIIKKSNVTEKCTKSSFPHSSINFNQNLGLQNDSFIRTSEEKGYANSLLNQENFFSTLTKKLAKTKKHFSIKLKNLFFRKEVKDSFFEDIEEQLLISDVGADTTRELVEYLMHNATRQELKNSKLVFEMLKRRLKVILQKVESPLSIDYTQLFVILVVGINGVGKTSLIGKLAKQYKQQGKSVMLVAGDTFRAAAIDQLKCFGDKSCIPVISRKPGSDSASVVYDALRVAKSENIDILIIDTAGRLHNKRNLMEELKKIKKVIRKVDSSIPQETLLVLDSCIGQNSIQQAEVFHQMLNITGLVITKLDGTAKGGVIFAIANKLLIPIRYLSFGESCTDIQVFNSEKFIDAIFNNSL